MQDLSIDGGGNGCSELTGNADEANIYGAAWVKTYNNNIPNPSKSGYFYEQPGLINVLTNSYGSAFGPKSASISSIRYWNRKSVN